MEQAIDRIANVLEYAQEETAPAKEDQLIITNCSNGFILEDTCNQEVSVYTKDDNNEGFVALLYKIDEVFGPPSGKYCDNVIRIVTVPGTDSEKWDEIDCPVCDRTPEVFTKDWHGDNDLPDRLIMDTSKNWAEICNMLNEHGYGIRKLSKYEKEELKCHKKCTN